MTNLKNLKSKLMENSDFVSEYDKIQPELDIIRALIDARTAKNLTQKELAKKTGIQQADISRLENGMSNPSLKLLKRLANGLDMILKIEFVPKTKE